jgi:nitrite reductase/ring-hydroxylating ferredoxin subunit
MPFVELIPLAKCRWGGGTFVPYGSLKLAVFYLVSAERVVVMDDTCPHAEGSLSAGDVTGNVVTCPWHQWQFDLDTGACQDPPRAHVRVYPAEIRDGVVWADLPDQAP